MGEREPRSFRSRALFIVTNLISVGALIWALRDAHLGELREDLATMDWTWVSIALVTMVIPFLWQAMRWRILLRPVERLGYWETARAVFVGLFANEVLPFRVGEVVRCYMLARNTGLPLSVSLTSALIERVFDGIWLGLCLFTVLRYVMIPRALRFLVDGGWVLASSVLVVAVLIAVAMFLPHRTHAALAGTRFQRQFQVFMDDLEKIGHSKYLALAFLQSAPYLLLQTVPIYAAFRGYGFDLSMGVAFALMVILRMGSVVPQAPGNLGLFQFLAKETLQRIFHIVPAEAARFSLVLWGVATLPLLAAGLISLSIAGLGFGELHRVHSSVPDRTGREPARSRDS